MGGVAAESVATALADEQPVGNGAVGKLPRHPVGESRVVAPTLHNKVQGEKTYRAVKDAVVFFDGKDESGKLADLPVGAIAELKLLTDGQTVREIRVK